MAQAIDLNEPHISAVPCEDCLSWFNTNRYFGDNTIIFSFEKDYKSGLIIRAVSLIELLSCRNLKTSNVFKLDKEIKYSKNAVKSIQKLNLEENKILGLLNKTYKSYKDAKRINISNQYISCSILVDDKIYSANKTDWTKRWFVEPLDYLLKNTLDKSNSSIKIDAISYFGDEYSGVEQDKFDDGVVSIKALGRVRQKYATSDTIIILNLADCIYVTTIGEFLPKKFVQGYKF